MHSTRSSPYIEDDAGDHIIESELFTGDMSKVVIHQDL